MNETEIIVIVLSFCTFNLLCTIGYCFRVYCCKSTVHAPIRPQRSVGQLVTLQASLENECAICLEEFNINEIIRILDCGHYYNKECVDPWLGSGKKCPKCCGENIV